MQTVVKQLPAPARRNLRDEGLISGVLWIFFFFFPMVAFGFTQFPYSAQHLFLLVTEHCFSLKSLLFICSKAPGQVSTTYKEPLAYLVLPSVSGHLYVLLVFLRRGVRSDKCEIITSVCCSLKICKVYRRYKLG